MENKKAKTELTTVPRDLPELEKETGNIYETVIILSKRANQIAAATKVELEEKLAEVAMPTDSLEEVFENREQIEISRQYERQPKATLVAIREFLDNKVYYRRPSEKEKD